MACKRIEFPSLAFIKLQLHLAKYPHCAVSGLLLACKRRYTEDHVLEIADVIPLFHQCIQLTPMLEIALTQIDSHCDRNQLIIAGYYEAPELLSAKAEPSLFSMKIADKIKSTFADSRLVAINNSKIPGLDSLVFYNCDSVAKRWTRSDDKVTTEVEVSDNLQLLLDRRVYRDLVDFDNHLCDISQHWLNQPINQLIKML